MMRLLAIPFVVLGSLGLAAAQFGPPEPVPENFCEPSFAVTDAGAFGTSLRIKQLQFGGYEATLHVYRQGDEDCVFDGDESIWFVLAIRNHLPVSRSLFFNTSRQHELDVLSAATGELVYRWGDDLAWDDVPTSIDFAPFETKLLYAWWDGRDEIGIPVAPGAYDVVAYIRSGAPTLRSDPRRVRLVP